VRGSVVWVNLPPPRSSRGHVQSGRRVAVILHCTRTTSSLPVLLVVPGTGQPGALRYPHTVEVRPDGTNGLSVPTVFMAFQLQAVDRRIIVLPPVGTLAPADLQRLEAAVKEVLGLP